MIFLPPLASAWNDVTVLRLLYAILFSAYSLLICPKSWHRPRYYRLSQHHLKVLSVESASCDPCRYNLDYVICYVAYSGVGCSWITIACWPAGAMHCTHVQRHTCMLVVSCIVGYHRLKIVWSTRSLLEYYWFVSQLLLCELRASIELGTSIVFKHGPTYIGYM